MCAGLTLLNAACKHLGIKVPASVAPGLRSLGCVPHSFSEEASRIGSQLPMVVTCSLMQILLAFHPSLSHFLHFFACASWDHLTQELPVPKSLSQGLPCGELELRQLPAISTVRVISQGTFT